MNTTSGRTCLILALLSLSPAAAVSIGLDARPTGVTVQAHPAGMQLQGDVDADADEDSVAPDADEDENDKTVNCAQRASQCLSPKQQFAFALAEDRRQNESKAFVALNDEIPPKSKD